MGSAVPIRKVLPNLSQMVEEYADERSLDLAPSTHETYRCTLRRFAAQSQDEGSRPDVVRFLQRAKSPNVHNLYRATLKCFFDWCIAQGYRADSPIDGIRTKKSTHKFTDTPVKALASFIQEGFDTTTYTGLRNKAAVLFLIDTGARPNEAWQLRPCDIDLAQGVALLRAETTKTRTPRTVFFSKPTTKLLNTLLGNRPDWWGPDVPIFAASTGGTMTSTLFGHVLRPVAARFGLNLTPYSLRHIFATNFLRGGGNALELQRILGHSNMQMTTRYANLNREDLQEAHRHASPVNALYPEAKRCAPRKLKK